MTASHHLRPDLDKHSLQECLCQALRNHKTQVQGLLSLQKKADCRDEGAWKEVGCEEETTRPGSVLESPWSCLCPMVVILSSLLFLSYNKGQAPEDGSVFHTGYLSDIPQ